MNSDSFLAAWVGPLLLLMLTGCSAPVPDYSATDTPMRRVLFDCERDESVELRFFPLQGVAVLLRNEETIELQQQPAGSGFWYSNGIYSVRGKGDEMRLEIARMMPLHCHAR